MKKYLFWIVLTLVVLAGAWYWWKQKPKGDSATDTTRKDTDKSNTTTNTTAATTASNTSGNYLDKNCGGFDTVWKKFGDPKETFFRNQWLGPNFKCQTALAQYILNKKENAGLVVDGEYGPASKAAVKKVFGKEQINLSELDVKYKLTPIVTGEDIMSNILPNW